MKKNIPIVGEISKLSHTISKALTKPHMLESIGKTQHWEPLGPPRQKGKGKKNPHILDKGEIEVGIRGRSIRRDVDGHPLRWWTSLMDNHAFIFWGRNLHFYFEEEDLSVRNIVRSNVLSVLRNDGTDNQYLFFLGTKINHHHCHNRQRVGFNPYSPHIYANLNHILNFPYNPFS